MKVHNDYIITDKLDLDLAKIKNSCYKMKDIIDNHFREKILEVDYTEAEGKLAPLTTQGFEHYNLFNGRKPGQNRRTGCHGRGQP